MNIKQLINTTLSISLLTASCFSSIAVATSDNTASSTEKTAPHHTGVFSGDLTESFNSGGYTYVHIKTDNGPVWAAGPITVIKESDRVGFTGKVAMIDFYSKSLDRKFETIYFVDSYVINGVSSRATSADPHKNIDQKQAKAIASFAKADGGNNIAEILSKKDSLSGKTVKVRGQVSKYTANVMGKNWLHIRDKSSAQDITITTDASAELNDIVLVEGLLILNKDYGYGYVYEVLISDAKLTIE